MPTGNRPARDDLVVDARELVKVYGETVALDRVDLSVSAGRVHGLVGPNGAGKTTLLAILMGMVRADAGRLRLFGADAPSSGTRTHPWVAGFVESPRFYPYLTARQNLELLAGLDGGCPPSRIGELLDLVGLGARGRARVRGFSVGMRQRLGIAAAMLRDPRLLVVDEPATGLDPAGLRDVRAMVRGLADDGVTVLLSSHDMDEVEGVCDDVTILRQGTVAFDGSMAQARSEAPDPRYLLTTSDDQRAAEIAKECEVDTSPRQPGGLVVLAGVAAMDDYVLALGRDGVAVRGLELQVTPLAALFFRRTETEDDAA